MALSTLVIRTRGPKPHQSTPPYASPFHLCTHTHTPWLCQLWSSEPEDLGLTSPPLPMPVHFACVHSHTHHGFVNFGHQNQRTWIHYAHAHTCTPKALSSFFNFDLEDISCFADNNPYD
ncbi:hypothetical protein EMCRGX_G026269 [Ephydatia muelleri]